jgi:hypothetical protein
LALKTRGGLELRVSNSLSADISRPHLYEKKVERLREEIIRDREHTTTKGDTGKFLFWSSDTQPGKKDSKIPVVAENSSANASSGTCRMAIDG